VLIVLSYRTKVTEVLLIYQLSMPMKPHECTGGTRQYELSITSEYVTVPLERWLTVLPISRKHTDTVALTTYTLAILLLRLLDTEWVRCCVGVDCLYTFQLA
jgi:hypothetical protein